MALAFGTHLHCNGLQKGPLLIFWLLMFVCDKQPLKFMLKRHIFFIDFHDTTTVISYTSHFTPAAA